MASKRSEDKALVITPNPIVDRLKGKGKLYQLEGYLSRGAAGKLEVYTDLSLGTCVEFNADDVLHVEPGEKSTDVSLIFVRNEATVAVKYETTAASLDQLVASGCHCSEPDGAEGYLAAMISGGLGATELTCDQKLSNCKKKCANKGAFRQGCLDSCAAAHRLCKEYGFGGGGGGIIMF